MKKRFLIPFVIIVALLLVVSCKKKEESGQSGPVVTVAAEPKTLDKEIPMLVVSEDVSTESVENIIEKKEEIT